MASTLAVLKTAFGITSFTPTDPGVIKLAAMQSGTGGGYGNVTVTPEIEAAVLSGKIQNPYPFQSKDTGFFDTTLPNILGSIVGGLTGVPVNTLTSTLATKPIVTQGIVPPKGGVLMSFADGDSSGFTLPSFGDINSILQGGLGQNILNLGTQALSGYIGNQFAPVYGPFPSPAPGGATPVMAAVPAIARGMAVVGRSFFNRFPNLATAIQGFLNRGIPVTRSKLYSLMKRFGPDFLISGGILSAAAISELAVAGPGRRRMNVGNVKALRKAHRRMKAFHHLCTSNDTLLHARRRPTKSGRFAGTSITQVK